MSLARERLKRLLLLVPYVVRHPGIHLDALAERLGVERQVLMGELDLLTLIGRPPYMPDDYIDLHVENERVWVQLDARLSAPPRFTVPEAVALAAAASLVGEAGGEVLRGAQQRLSEALPPAARESFRELASRVDTRGASAAGLEPLSRALREHRVVTFDYLTPGREKAEARRVRPQALEALFGHWYLTGYDEGRKGVRQFRLDRLTGLAVTADPFAPGSDPAPTRRAREAAPALLRASASAAPYLRERAGQAGVIEPDGQIRFELPAESEGWLVRWVLAWGGEVEVLEPPAIRAAVARAARDSLKCGTDDELPADDR